MLCLDIQSLGPIFGQPGSLLRRQSIQRAATVNSRKSNCQVIIKNTFSLKDGGADPTNRLDSISRSHTLMSTSRIPTLAPRRVDRQRMEHRLSAVWTENLLPYPGMTGYHGGQLIRRSASSLMRKLSVASMASGASRYSKTASTTGSFAKQRKVTYGSIERSSPYPAQVESYRANQTDGAASPHLEQTDSQSDNDEATSGYREPSIVEELSIDNPERNIVYVTKVGTVSEISQDSGDGDTSEASTVVLNVTVKFSEPERVKSNKEKGTLRKHKKLMKALSTENIRRWFH